ESQRQPIVRDLLRERAVPTVPLQQVFDLRAVAPLSVQVMLEHLANGPLPLRRLVDHRLAHPDERGPQMATRLHRKPEDALRFALLPAQRRQGARQGDAPLLLTVRDAVEERSHVRRLPTPLPRREHAVVSNAVQRLTSLSPPRACTFN